MKKKKKKEDILRNTIIFIGVALVIFFLVFFITKDSSVNISTYKGLIFDERAVGNITFYHTSFPLFNAQNSKVADYNLFIRTPLANLEKIPFEGDLILYNQVVINMTDDFHCEGKGIISLANLANLYDILGVSIINNETIGCSPGKDYNFYQIISGNTTEIVETDVGCYDLVVSSCDILGVTEKMMVEVLSQIKSEGTIIYLLE